MSNEIESRALTPEELDAAIREARRLRSQAFLSVFRRSDKSGEATAHAVLPRAARA